MRLADHVHRLDIGDALQEVYLHRFLFKLALGTVTIFLPLYIIDLGFDPLTVFSFYAAYYGAFIVAALPAARLATRIGYIHTSRTAAAAILLFYLLLRGIPADPLLIHLTAVVGGIGFVTYWIGMNAEMAQHSRRGRHETETGYFFSMPLLASVAAPFLGGLVIAFSGFHLLFITAALLAAVSFAPFLFSQEQYTGLAITPRSLLHRGHLSDLAALTAQGAVSMGRKVLWPLYLALLVDAVVIGSAGSLLALGGAIASFLVGRYTTPANSGRVMLVGGVLAATTYAAMSLVTTPLQAVTVAFANGTMYFAVSLPVYARVIGAAEREDVLAYITFREIALCTGRLLALAAFVLLFLTVPTATAFRAGFLLAAAATIATAIFGRYIQ